MSGRNQTGPGGLRADAAGWVVRLACAEAGEGEWLAFAAWLEAEPGARKAYDAALALWLLADRLGAQEALQEGLVRDRHVRNRRGGVGRGTPLLSRFGG